MIVIRPARVRLFRRTCACWFLAAASVVFVHLAAVAAQSPNDIPVAAAKECRERGGLANFFAKLEKGDDVRIGYLGGSITLQPGWRPQTLAWFQDQFPQARIAEINASVAGTGSDLGVFRLRRDLLDHQPDLLFVEFAVNDRDTPSVQILRAMEGIVRQTWRSMPSTDICFVYTLEDQMVLTLQQGKFPRAVSAMESVADHYGIPSIHMGLEVAKLAGEGKLVMKADPKTDEARAALAGKIIFSPDGRHPDPRTGHELYLKAVVRSMDVIRGAGKPGPRVLGPALVPDNWEAAKMVPIRPSMLSAGWEELNSARSDLAKRFGSSVPELWRAAAPGETLAFKFKGTGVGIYNVIGPDAGQVEVTLDDQPARRMALFDPYCTVARLQKLTIATDLLDTVHTVKIAVSAAPLDKAAILGKQNKTIDDPNRFVGGAFYPGAILLIGDLIE